MPKLTADAPLKEKQTRMKDEMEKFKSGDLHVRLEDRANGEEQETGARDRAF
jgi:hypothetical protein